MNFCEQLVIVALLLEDHQLFLVAVKVWCIDEGISNNMLLLTNCEVHTGKYLDRSFEVRTERSEVHT